MSSYYEIEVPGTYWVDMNFEPKSGSWKVARRIRMPEDYSTRLRFTNVREYSQLASYRDRRIRFTVELQSRQVRKVDEVSWLATYSAKVVGLCAAPLRRRSGAAASE